MNAAFFIRPVRTDEEHVAALRTIESLWEAAPGTDAYDQLDILTTLVEAYEGKRWPLAAVDPVEALEVAIASGEHSRAELAGLIGQSRATEVLSRQRALSLSMIRKIHDRWHLPLEALVREYRLTAGKKTATKKKADVR